MAGSEWEDEGKAFCFLCTCWLPSGAWPEALEDRRTASKGCASLLPQVINLRARHLCTCHWPALGVGACASQRPGGRWRGGSRPCFQRNSLLVKHQKSGGGGGLHL